MDLTLADRCRMVVKWIAEQKKITMSQVGELIGYNNASSFSQVLNSKRDMPSTFPERIASLDPRINIDFLTGDSDDMLLTGDDLPAPGGQVKRQGKPPKDSSGAYLPPELMQMFSDLSAAVRGQQETIDYLIKNR